MKTFNFIMRVSGSAKGTIKANSKREALKMIKGGQWEDIDIDVEDVIEVEHLSDKAIKREVLNQMNDIDLSKFEKIEDNFYFGVMSFKDYVSLVKEKVPNTDKTIINKAKVEAMKYNNDIESNEVYINPINLFITEVGLTIFDSFASLVILNLEERFMYNMLGVVVHTVSLVDARKIVMQLRSFEGND